MASVITIAFENWKAQEAASGKAVLLDEFVFANVPNLDPTQPIDRNEKLPPANQIVHRQAVNKAGLASENAVAYSVTLGADVGDFDFNWIGLLNKESGTVAMITHAPLQKKLKTQNGQQGNVLIRSFLLEFQGAAVETQIKTSAETWQIDFTARLAGIDEMQRLINLDSYGAAAFFNDGFEVTRSGEQYTVKKGLGYVGGLRGELTQNQILNNLRNTKVYADFSYQGNIVSQWNTIVKITSASTLANYVDAAGFTHQVFAIASIDASGNVKDLRPMGALSSQEISALETRFKLDLSKKIDKANITDQTGNSGELVASQRMVTTELGKKQPAGNYAPAGDYATNTALNNGLDRKFDKTEVVETTGSSTTKVMSQNGVTKALRSSELIQSANQIIRDTKSDASDFNNAKANAAFFGYATALNNAAITGVGIDIAQIGNGYHLQLISAFNHNEIAFRTKNGDKKTWNDWCKFFHTGNVKVDRNGNLKTSDTSNALSDCCVGIPLPWPQSTAPTGYLICNGQTFNKTTYPLLALAYPSGVLPDLRGEFIRGLDTGRNVDSGRAALSAQSDAIRNIKGSLNLGLLDKLKAEGAFKKTAYTEGSGGGSSGYTKNSAEFDASLVVPTANENRPRNIAFLYIVRAA